METVSDFWEWISDEFIIKFSPKGYYNGQTYPNVNLFLNDHSSLFIGSPMIRQLRVKKGNFNIKT